MDDEPILDYDEDQIEDEPFDSPPFECEDEPPTSPILSSGRTLAKTEPSPPDQFLKPRSFTFKKPLAVKDPTGQLSKSDSCDNIATSPTPLRKTPDLQPAKGFDFNASKSSHYSAPYEPSRFGRDFDLTGSQVIEDFDTQKEDVFGKANAFIDVDEEMLEEIDFTNQIYSTQRFVHFIS